MVEKTTLEGNHKREVDDYLNRRLIIHQAMCHKCNPSLSAEHSGYTSEGSRPHTPPVDVGATQQLRNIVSRLLELNKEPLTHKKEKLEHLDKELHFVQQYLSSGRPYPRGEVPSPMTRNNFTFSQCQPNSDIVQSIVKRVLTAGHERENLIKHSQRDVPESVFEPEKPEHKKAQDNLNQVMSSVRQVMNQPAAYPSPTSKGEVGESQLIDNISKGRVQKIKEQVVTSHKSIREGLRRSHSNTLRTCHAGEHEPAGSLHLSQGEEIQHMSQQQRKIHDVLSESKQHIEKTIQQQYTKSSREPP